MPLLSPRQVDRLATGTLWGAAIVIVLILIGLVGTLVYQGLRVIDLRFLTTPPETLFAGGGIGPPLWNSIYLLVLSLLFTVPLGLGGGIYLAEYARDGIVTRAIRASTETLASLPSIVIGLFGLLVFVNLTGWGYSLMAGALALTVLNLPVMVRVSEEALRNVPRSLKEGSLALGATHWQTIVRVSLPAAFPSLISGVIITAGRAFGEAAALLYTAGLSSPPLDFRDWNPMSPFSPLNPFRPAETLAVHIWKVNTEGLIPDVRRVADGSAAVLVISVLMFNLGARWLADMVHRRLTAQR